MDNTVNFKGAFIIKSSGETKEVLKKIASKKAFIYDRYSHKGDLYVVSGGNDYNVAEFVYKNKLKCEYYPGLNKSSGFIWNSAESAKDVLKAKAVAICGISELNAYFGGKFRRKANKTNVEELIQALNCSQEDVKEDIMPNGMLVLRNKYTKKIIAKSSPKSPAGINYVYVVPINQDSSPILASVKDGTILRSYSMSDKKDYSLFKTNFSNAIEFYNQK